MEKQEGLFIPKRTKRPSELIGELQRSEESKKRRQETSQGGDRVVIVKRVLDNDRERRAQLSRARITRCNTLVQSIDDTLFKQNIVVAAQLAAYLYLDATTVIQYCFYWLGEYNNKEVPSDLLFNDLINGVLYHPPVLEIAGQYGLKYKLDNHSSYSLLLRFAGSELHRVPHVHFTQRGTVSSPDRENAPLLKGLAYVLNPRNRCFLNVSGPGMPADLQLDHFIYNTVLEEFYEPSFIILTCFMLTLNYQRKSFLYNIVAGKKVNKRVVTEIELELGQKRIDLIQTSLSVLEAYVDANLHNTEEDEESGRTKQSIMTSSLVRDCIDPMDTDGTIKRTRLVYDLVALIVVMRQHRNDIEQLYASVAEQWLEKAKYCASEMATRMGSIIEHL